MNTLRLEVLAEKLRVDPRAFCYNRREMPVSSRVANLVCLDGLGHYDFLSR